MSERSMALAPKTTAPVLSQAPVGLLQRKCACGQHTMGGECEECKKKNGMLQRKSMGETARSTAPPIVHEVLRSPGQPLDSATRAFFERRFGRDFSQVPIWSGRQPGLGLPSISSTGAQSKLDIAAVDDPLEREAEQRAERVSDSAILDSPTRRVRAYDFSSVRIHTDAKASESARAINALAYTAGHHVVLASPLVSLHSQQDRRLLGHELAHVVQQSSARTPGIQRTPDDAPMSTRTRQLACVIRLGGCPSSRDGGIPSEEEIKNYNQRCRPDTHYTAADDIHPTNEECLNPPREPLSTAEKIFLGGLLLVGGLLVATAVIVVGAEVIPIAIAAVGEAATASIAFYLGNAIVVNEVGLFATGLLLSCEGDVAGLLRAMADDPTQAAAILAEVYILHVNIRVANGPTRRASLPVKVLPPDQQTDPQHIKLKTAGLPTFEEGEIATAPGAKAPPQKRAQQAHPAPQEETPSAATPPRAATKIPEAPAPSIKGIGPAYATFEEIDALIKNGQIRSKSHVLGVVVKDPQGKIVARWFEVSERGVGTEQAKLIGHTEQKALARIEKMKNVESGSTVEFVGSLQSCNLREGCSRAMEEFAQRTGVFVRYRYVYGDSGTTINDFTPSEGRITKGMREGWKH